jgi:hypothetical protein
MKEEAVSHRYDHHFAKVIKSALKTMRNSELTSDVEISDNVEVSDNLRDCAIVLKASSDSVPIENLLELAYHAFLDAASQSKPIHVMGFCSPRPLNSCPSGFEVTLGAMERATTACWHVFKRGFCRHGDDCRRQHPACKTAIRIHVETSQLNAPAPSIYNFKLNVADFVSSVVSAIEGIPSCANVEATMKESSQCWTIELTPNADVRVNEENLLGMVKSILLSHSRVSKGVYMLGYAAKPFIPRPSGCMVILGDMTVETGACWDFYSKGRCRKGCECKWEHPSCSMPIDIVIKPKLQTR